MRILAAETSCDDTAVAIVEDGRRVLANVIHSQVEMHTQYGGVVPEAAARQHIESINECLTAALQEAGLSLDDIDCFAATMGPGLVGSLLIGANAAKTLSLVTGKPFRGVHHLFAHVASNYLESDLEPPFLCLLVSGGHTQLIRVEDYQRMYIVGETLDDAVGEAYDKVARLMGLPYPGGPAIDRLAPEGNPRAFSLPRAQVDNPFDFSFSGLKTATLRTYEKAMAGMPSDADAQQFTEALRKDLAASFQHTVIETLWTKTARCAEHYGINTVAVAGGVSANRGLRQRFLSWAEQETNLKVYFPQMAFCTDNAAMVAASAFCNPITSALDFEVFSRSDAFSTTS